MLQTILLGVMDEENIGLQGFVQSIASTVCGIICGHLTDTYFRRRYKVPLLFALSLCAVATAWFTFSLKSPLFSNESEPLLGTPVPLLLGAALLIAGAMQGTAVPLMYELCAELTYPVPEGTSAGILVFLFNFASFIVLLVGSYIDVHLINTIWTATLVVVIVMVACVKERYLRTDAEDAEASAAL